MILLNTTTHHASFNSSTAKVTDFRRFRAFLSLSWCEPLLCCAQYGLGACGEVSVLVAAAAAG